MLFFDPNSQDSMELMADIGFVVVILGVALEIVDVAAKRIKEHRNESILAKDAWWLWWVEVCSVVLVVLGLGVELFGGHKASLLAHKKSDELQMQATAALEKSASAEKDAGDSKLLAARLSLRIEELRKANDELELEIQPRRIMPEQADAINRDLAAWGYIRDKCEVRIRVQPTDIEAKIFAEQIGNLLGKHFIVTTDEGVNASFGSDFGTRFEMHGPPSESERAIARALKILPLEPIQIEISSNLQAGTLLISIFPKEIK